MTPYQPNTDRPANAPGASKQAQERRKRDLEREVELIRRQFDEATRELAAEIEIGTLSMPAAQWQQTVPAVL